MISDRLNNLEMLGEYGNRKMIYDKENNAKKISVFYEWFIVSYRENKDKILAS